MRRPGTISPTEHQKFKKAKGKGRKNEKIEKGSFLK